MAEDCNFVARLCKGVNETRRVGIDFVDFIVTGETLSDPPTVTATPALGAPTISGQDIVAGVGGGLTAAIANVAAGTAGTYKIWFACTTSSGQVIKKHVTLTVEAE